MAEAGDDLAESSSRLDLSTQLPSPKTGRPVPPRDNGAIVGLGCDRGHQRASDVLIGALNADNVLPTQVQPSTDLYIHRQLYMALLTKRAREPTPNNP